MPYGFSPQACLSCGVTCAGEAPAYSSRISWGLLLAASGTVLSSCVDGRLVVLPEELGCRRQVQGENHLARKSSGSKGYKKHFCGFGGMSDKNNMSKPSQRRLTKEDTVLAMLSFIFLFFLFFNGDPFLQKQNSFCS